MPETTDLSATLLQGAADLRDYIVDLTLRLAHERTVNYLTGDFPGEGPDGMESPGQESKVCAILAKELDNLGIPHTTHANTTTDPDTAFGRCPVSMSGVTRRSISVFTCCANASNVV